MVKSNEENHLILLEKIKTKIGSPVSVPVVVATLESLGVKSENVKEDYGFADSWKLAESIYGALTAEYNPIIKNEKELEPIPKKVKQRKILLDSYAFFKQYFISTSYLLAFAIQITSIIFYGFSIYIYTGFNHVQSTIVVLGIIIGMVISGGFIQVIGNQVSKHFYLEDYILVEKMTFSLLKKGAVFIVAILSVILIFHLIFPFYTIQTALLIASYAFWVGLLFLVFAPLHVIKNKKVIIIATIVATVICLFFLQSNYLNIYALHFLGLFTAISTVLLFLIYFFKRKKRESKPSKVSFQKGALFYNNIYPFLYGILINLFFFIDRIIAWSGYEISNFFMPIYYEKDYEIGMDIAIIFFLLLAGILEYGNATFFHLLHKERQNTTLVDIEKMKKKITSLYLKNNILIGISAIPIYLVIHYIFYGKWGYNYFFTEPLKEINIKIANIGVVGYLFLCCGMLNSSYLLSLKKQKVVLKILAIACITNFTSGYFISRFSSYENSVYGMLIAAVIFMLLSFRENLRVHKNIDYYATL